MTASNQPPRPSSRAASRFWMLFPVLLLTVSVSGWLVMVSIAVDDPGFSVERDYYKKAAGYDAQLAQRAINEQLGWTARIVEVEMSGNDSRLITLQFDDIAGNFINDLTVETEAFAVARGKDIRISTAKSLGGGRYQFSLDQPRSGLWEVRLTARGHDALFSHTLRVELRPDGRLPS